MPNNKEYSGGEERTSDFPIIKFSNHYPQPRSLPLVAESSWTLGEIIMKVCPNCSSEKTTYIRQDMPYPTPVVFLALGGVFFAVIYGSSRRGIYQCNSCKETFKKHSIVSILTQPLLWLYLLFYACIVIAVGFTVVMLIWDAI